MQNQKITANEEEISQLRNIVKSLERENRNLKEELNELKGMFVISNVYVKFSLDHDYFFKNYNWYVSDSKVDNSSAENFNSMLSDLKATVTSLQLDILKQKNDNPISPQSFSQAVPASSSGMQSLIKLEVFQGR